MFFRAVHRFLIAPFAIAEDLAAERGKLGIVGIQFRTGVHMVVDGVVLAVVVEPRLHAFSPVFVGVGRSIGILP